METDQDAGRRLAEHLFAPKSIVVIGASNDTTKIGGKLVAHLREGGFTGDVHLVSRSGPTVQGLPAVPDVDSIPGDASIDLAVVATPARAVAGTVEALGRRGVPVAVVVSSGFGETGTPEGRRLQEELRTAGRDTGIRVLGPNCQGVANLAVGLVASFSSTFSRSSGLADGSTAVLSQSGAMAAVLTQLAQPHVDGVRYWAATGNELDLRLADLLHGVVADPDVRTVQLYLEHLGAADALAAAAATAAENGTAILALKSGTTAAGGRAAGSHTGALAQEDAVVDAFFRRHRIVRARDPREMSELTRLFAQPRRPRGGGVACVTNSGGLGVLLSDEAEAHGLRLAGFGRRTLGELGENLPSFAAIDNPVDVTAQLLSDPGLVRAALAAVEQDEDSDVIVVALGILGEYYDVDRILADVVDLRRRTDKLVVVCWVAGQPGMVERFAAHGVPAFDDTTACMRALGALVRHTATGRTTPVLPAPGGGEDRSTGTGLQSEHRGKQILGQWGLPVVATRLASDPDEAVAAARRIGYPVVLKVSAPTLAHKTELGLVQVGISDDAALRESAGRMLATAAGQVRGGIDGLLVEPVERGVAEMTVGVVHDDAVGPVIMIGAGGVQAELLGDVRLLVPPCTESDVRSALESLALFPLLQGYRGRPGADVAAFVQLVVELSTAPTLQRGLIAELDLNPVIVRAEGQGIALVDVALTLRDPVGDVR